MYILLDKAWNEEKKRIVCVTGCVQAERDKQSACKVHTFILILLYWYFLSASHKNLALFVYKYIISGIFSNFYAGAHITGNKAFIIQTFIIMNRDDDGDQV